MNRDIGAGVRLFAAAAWLGATAALASGWQADSLEGETVTLGNYTGQWVVLNYWATWCKPCREEMPELDRLDRERADLAVIGIAWEDTGAAELRAFLDAAPVGYPIVPADPFDPPAGLEPPRVLPTTVVFAPDGAEVERLYGPVTGRLIEELIARGGD